MKLVDMKLPKKSKKEMKEEVMPSPDADEVRYPYGLELRFEKDSIDKLDMLQDVNADDEVEITAKGFVKEVRITSTSENSGRRNRQCVEIQITKIGITSKDYEDKQAEKAFKEGAA